MCRKGRAVPISRDHKSHSLDEKKRIMALHGFVTEERRVNGVLALSRALGDVAYQPHVTVRKKGFEIGFFKKRFFLSQYRPDVLEMDINEAIEYIILACDGLWDVMSNEEVIDIVKQVGSPAAAAITIRDMAYQLGSSDNISVIVISLKSRIKSL